MVVLAASLAVAFALVLAAFSAVGARQDVIDREIDALESVAAKEERR